jgi:hypothetical protein
MIAPPGPAGGLLVFNNTMSYLFNRVYALVNEMKTGSRVLNFGF